MNLQRIMTVLKAPHVSEKASTPSGDYRQYAFKVIKDATKPEIKAAIEHIFKVKVRNVRVCNMKSKSARFGRIIGRRSGWKKAYVTLDVGQELDAAGIK